MRNAYKILVGKPEVKEPRAKHTWEDNIRVKLREIAW